MKDLLFKGWGIKLDQLETMIELCRKAKQEELQFGVACFDGGHIEEFIDPVEGAVYNYGKYKMFVRGCSFTVNSQLLSFPILSGALFDEFPPIPPTPIKDPGGG